MKHKRRRRRLSLRAVFFGRGGFKAWPLVITIGIFAWVKSNNYMLSIEELNQAAEISIPIIALFFILLAFWFIIKTISLRQKNSKIVRTNTFRDKPWEYDRMIVTVTGKIDYIFKNDFSYVMQRKITNAYRNLTKDGSHIARHIHQRFLLSSPQLQQGERIMIIHNTNFGEIDIKTGSWVSVKGEYIGDKENFKAFGQRYRHCYGKIHYTHSPKGYIKVLATAPKLEEIGEVRTEEPKKTTKL
jgi:hypothetical protein